MLPASGEETQEVQAWLGHHAASITQNTYIEQPPRPRDVDALGLDPLEAR
jgi:hypothetical protein